MSKHSFRASSRTIVNPKLENRGGEWFIAFSYRNDGQGRTYSGRERLGAIDRHEAKVAFAAWQTTQVQLNAVTASKTLDEILTPYEAAILARPRPPRTYCRNLETLRDALGAMPIALIDTRLLNNFAKEREIQSQTLRSYVGTLNAAFQFAAHEGLVTLAEQRKFKLPARSQPRDFYLRSEEAEALLARAMAESDGKAKLAEITKLVALAMDTGARREALFDLTWDRIDLKANTIDFRIPGRTVVNKRRVKLQVFKRLRPLMERAYCERVSDTAPFLSGGYSDLFRRWVLSIPDWKGTRLEQTTLHSLRHTFATLLIVERNVPLDRVAALLGDNLATVSSTYAHLRASHEDFEL